MAIRVKGRRGGRRMFKKGILFYCLKQTIFVEDKGKEEETPRCYFIIFNFYCFVISYLYLYFLLSTWVHNHNVLLQKQ